MADDLTLDPGSGGATLAADDIGGVHHQRVKVQHGADGSATDVSTASPLPVNINNDNTVSTNNSNSTPLAGDAVFTGTGEDISNFSSMTVQVFASHASATDGLSVEFSTDNSNWDEKHTATIAATTSRDFIFPSHAKYFRVVYTNGSTPQTSFRLQTMLHVQGLPSSSHALDESAHADDVGTLTKAVVIAQAAGTGDFVPVQATTAGNLKVSIEEADTSASGLAKAEDAPHSSGDVGVMALGVRTDTPVATAADGDYTPFITSEEGAVWVETLPSEIEAGNSTTTPLAGDAVFTGTGVDLLDHQTVCVMLDASHDSATDGMQFQFSTDNTNWDYSVDFTYTAADGGRIFQFGIYARYFRIVYTNGSTGQTHFRVQTLLHHETTLTTIHRLVDNASPDRSAEISKSVTIAQAAGSGDFVPVQATAAGNFKVSVEEFDGALLGGGAEADALLVTIANDSTGLLSVDDNGGSLTVDNAALSVTGGGTEAAAMRVTVANDSTGVLGVDDNGGSLTVDNGGTFAVQVDAALPAGTNAIGKLSANSGVDIGDVDVTSVIPGTAATNLGKAEDAAHSSGDTGVMPLAVRNDTLAALAGTDGDYAPLQVDAAGAQFVTNVPNATHGHSFYLNQDTSAVASVKASAGTIYWIACMSTDATPVYLNLYNVASGSVTLGTTTPSLQFVVPSQGDANGAGFTINFGPHGIKFGTAITVACATTFDGSGDPGTNVVITNIGYE